MDIVDNQGKRIDSLAAWARLYQSPRSAQQWKEHRSAYSMAEFILHRDGAGALRARIADALGEAVEFEKAIPEREIRFDLFGRGRMHDLGIYGRTGSGKSLFVGVEAKVDEPFGALVREAYLAAKARQIAGESTHAPARMEQLLKLHFASPDPSVFEVRYQLLYATAGTLAAGADISVLYIVVFKTPLYNEIVSAENYRDYVDFMAKAGASPLKLSSKEAQGHKLVLGGKELVCLHEYFELRG
ncbi:DUF6946 family protein [Methylomagnum ishizawai]|uniref:DUF6946 family protein n=1 Tax=Methylomagnum ishizawai TaxID=1760988 RepID=UPI001C342AA1|nr:hypothetical protein [Methylomagnum ishizawai]BBL76357.1 hypothetical protein MishRS11D_34550 [Methylomagnum ishizawai]